MTVDEIQKYINDVKEVGTLIFGDDLSKYRCSIYVSSIEIISDDYEILFRVDKNDQCIQFYSKNGTIKMDDMSPDVWFNACIINDIGIDYNIIASSIEVLKKSGNNLSLRILKNYALEACDAKYESGI